MSFRRYLRLLLPVLAVLLLAGVAAGCGRDDDDSGSAAGGEDTTETTASEELSGRIQADGSSTVGPLTTAAAELFREEQPNVNITVGTAGTGGGFERFCAGETDISNASRPIDEEEEVPLCEDGAIEYTELQVATDALTVVVNSENNWAECLTVDQLKAIWEPGSKIKNWQDVPGGDFPDEPMPLAGAGTDSGTFDYFTDAIVGEEGASRSDYTATEDDNVTVRAVQGDAGALGYFGFSYYEENQDTLKALQVDGGEGCVAPSADTARDGSYTPLSRPLFVYVKSESLAKPEVQEFLRFYFANLETITEQAQFIPMDDTTAQEQNDKLETAIEATGGA